MLFHAIFENALDAMLLADDEGSYLDANPAACALTGYERDELVGLTGADLSADAGAFGPAWSAFLAAGHAEGTHRLRRRDGVVVETEFRAVADVAAGVHLSVMHDITERVAAERRAAERGARAERLVEETTRVTHELEATVERLRALDSQRRQLISELLTARADERRRLGRELHDGLGQVMTTIKLLAVGLRHAPTAEVRAGLRDIQDLVQKGAESTRDLVGQLRDESPEDPTLRAGLLRLAAETEGLHGLPVEISADVSGPLPVPVATAAHRIASEALTNAIKHAAATSVSVVAMSVDERLMLVVEDDGVGFDPRRVAASARGHGLVGMGERAEELGGTMTVAAAPGRGTTIRAELPVDA